MKTRWEVIQNCRYPSLPEQSCSVCNFLQNLNQNRSVFSDHFTDSVFWLGGRLTGPVSAHSFSLSAQSYQLKCFVSEECHLFFDFGAGARNIRWKEVFSLLGEGDHLLIHIPHTLKKAREIKAFRQKTKYVWLVKNIEKLVLVSVNKEKKALFSSSVFIKRQRDWFSFLDNVHKGAQQMGLERVSTPTLVDCPGTEPALDLFETQLYHDIHDTPAKNTALSSEKTGMEQKTRDKEHKQISKKTEKTKLYLATSPEINMKLMLCQGWTDIYEIKKCFRNSESGAFNHTEFHLLEWYRAYSHLNTLIKDIEYLLGFLSAKMSCSPFPELKKASMRKLFKKYINMELHPNSSRKDFMRKLTKHNIPFGESDDIEDLFHLLFLNKIEPFIAPEIPLIVYDYPPFQKAYARIGAEGWTSRFELFWKGMELANAFDEVTEEKEQALRFQEDNLKRGKQGKIQIQADQPLLNGMKRGMPPSSGVALGLERVFMALKGLDDIHLMRVT